MALKVTLREHYSGFANVPNTWIVRGIDVAPTPVAKDNGEGRDVRVQLPDGYTVLESVAGELMVYSVAGHYCEIMPGKGGKPQLVDPERGYVALALAEMEP